MTLRGREEVGRGVFPPLWAGRRRVGACSRWCVCWCVVLFVVRWTELVAGARVRVSSRGTELGGWCVLVRAPGLTELVVREVRLAQGIVAEAV